MLIAVAALSFEGPATLSSLLLLLVVVVEALPLTLSLSLSLGLLLLSPPLLAAAGFFLLEGAIIH